MNSKKAKALRKQAYALDTRETEYSTTRDSIWGPIPSKEVMQKAKDPKWRTTRDRRGTVTKEFRYQKGIPVKVVSGFRKKYLELKCEVA